MRLLSIVPVLVLLLAILAESNKYYFVYRIGTLDTIPQAWKDVLPHVEGGSLASFFEEEEEPPGVTPEGDVEGPPGSCCPTVFVDGDGNVNLGFDVDQNSNTTIPDQNITINGESFLISPNITTIVRKSKNNNTVIIIALVATLGTSFILAGIAIWYWYTQKNKEGSDKTTALSEPGSRSKPNNIEMG
jgi:hypothetical protein